MGAVTLVERRSDKQLFAAKKQLKSSEFRFAKQEFKMLKKLEHPGIVNVIDSFHDLAQEKLIIILEYCPCKTSLFVFG